MYRHEGPVELIQDPPEDDGDDDIYEDHKEEGYKIIAYSLELKVSPGEGGAPIQINGG